MSKKNIQSILDKVIAESQKDSAYRQVSDRLVHIYEVDLNDLIKEVTDQISGTYVKSKDSIKYSLTDRELTVIKKATTKYFNSVREGLRSTKAFEVSIISSSNTSFVAEISPLIGDKYSNVFEFIKRSRRASLEKLREELLIGLQHLEGKGTIEQRVLGNYNPTTDVRSGGLLELGHLAGTSVAEQRVVNSLKDIDLKAAALRKKQVAESHPILRLHSELHSNPDISKLKEIKFTAVFVRDQSKAGNRAQSDYESKLISVLRRELTNAVNSEDWFNFKGSPSAVDMVVGKLHAAAQEAGAKKVNRKAVSSLKQSKVSYEVDKKVSGKITKERSKESLKAKAVTSRVETTPANWSSVVGIINAKLNETVVKYMVFPRLQNRTGTFASSVRVNGVETTKDGYPSFIVDYSRTPYGVFDRYTGAQPWNTPERDPKSLITLAIRDIVKDLAISKFYTRRA